MPGLTRTPKCPRLIGCRHSGFVRRLSRPHGLTEPTAIRASPRVRPALHPHAPHETPRFGQTTTRRGTILGCAQLARPDRVVRTTDPRTPRMRLLGSGMTTAWRENDPRLHAARSTGPHETGPAPFAGASSAPPTQARTKRVCAWRWRQTRPREPWVAHAQPQGKRPSRRTRRRDVAQTEKPRAETGYGDRESLGQERPRCPVAARPSISTARSGKSVNTPSTPTSSRNSSSTSSKLVA